MKDDKKDDFAFTLTKMPKEGDKKSYSISFTFGESLELVVFRDHTGSPSLRIQINNSQNKKNMKNINNSKNKLIELF